MASDNTIPIHLRADIGNVPSVMNQAAGAINSFSNTAKTASGSLGGVSNGMGGLLKSATVLVAGYFTLQAAIRGVVGAGKLIGGFEQSMSKVKAITGANAEQFKVMSAEARRLGAATTFSASQAAEGMTYLGMAGFTAEEAVTALEGTLQLAQAGGLELGASADIASNVLGGFGMRADETGRVVDVLANIASKANTNVTEMGEAMKYAAPLSTALGISLEESSAAIGILSNNGIKAGLVGRGLSAVLGMLINPNKEGANALRKMGRTVNDVNPELHGLKGALEGLKGMSTQDLAKMFGASNLDVVLSLLNNLSGEKGLEGLTTAMENSKGRAGDMAKTMTDNLPGALAELRSAFEELILGVGDAGLGNFFKDIVRATTEGVRKIDFAIKTISKAFQSGDIGALFTASLKIGAGTVVNYLGGGLSLIGDLFVKRIVGAFTLLTSPAFWGGLWDSFTGLHLLLGGIAMQFAVSLGKGLLPMLASVMGGFSTAGDVIFTGFVRAGSTLVEFAAKAAGTILEAVNSIPGISVDGMIEQVRKLRDAAHVGANVVVDIPKTFDTATAEARAGLSVMFLETSNMGKKVVDAGVASVTSGFGKLGTLAMDNYVNPTVDAFKNFAPADIIDLGPAQSEFARLVENNLPDSMEKSKPDLTGPVKSAMEDAGDKGGKAVVGEMEKAIADSMRSIGGGGGFFDGAAFASGASALAGGSAAALAASSTSGPLSGGASAVSPELNTLLGIHETLKQMLGAIVNGGSAPSTGAFPVSIVAAGA